jgi:hypothetical protein
VTEAWAVGRHITTVDRIHMEQEGAACTHKNNIRS